jgi:hypothetical protein
MRFYLLKHPGALLMVAGVAVADALVGLSGVRR